jgi:hypothetical protein
MLLCGILAANVPGAPEEHSEGNQNNNIYIIPSAPIGSSEVNQNNNKDDNINKTIAYINFSASVIDFFGKIINNYTARNDRNILIEKHENEKILLKQEYEKNIENCKYQIKDYQNLTGKNYKEISQELLEAKEQYRAALEKINQLQKEENDTKTQLNHIKKKCSLLLILLVILIIITGLLSYNIFFPKSQSKKINDPAIQ